LYHGIVKPDYERNNDGTCNHRECFKPEFATFNCVQDCFAEVIGENGMLEESVFKCKQCGYQFTALMYGIKFNPSRWVGDITHEFIKGLMREHLIIKHEVAL